MAHNTYQYEKLDDGMKDIRLITLLAGEVEDKIRLSISHASLETSTRPPKYGHLLEKAQETLPDGWKAFDVLDGRILFINEDLGGSTSWEHPNPKYTSSYNVAAEEDEDLTQRPVYEAISYIWGSTDNMRDVLIETQNSTHLQQYARISVGQNLYSAFQHLRYTHTTRTLWSDIICINQADELERNQQVARMKDIFKLADRVVVWLGPATDNSQHALETLGYLGKQAVSTNDRRRMPTPDAAEKDWCQTTIKLPFEDHTWAAMSSLLQRSWFQRLWIVQEIHLARKDIFVCGYDEFNWMYLRYAILLLWYNKDSLFRLPARLRLTGQLAETVPEKHPISDTNYQVYGRMCTNNRYRVYGIHGLFPTSFQQLIRPQYSLSVGDVYTELALAHIAYGQRLEILRLCHTKDGRIKCPSWAPDLSSNLKIARRMDWQFSAGCSRAQVSFESPILLKVTGVHCATLTNASEPLPDNSLDCLRAVRSWEPANLDSGLYPTGESIRTAWAKTVIGNCLRDRLPERKFSELLEIWKPRTHRRLCSANE